MRTNHGHHIPGSPDTSKSDGRVQRSCAGPGYCTACNYDVAVYHQLRDKEQEKQKELLANKKYRRVEIGTFFLVESDEGAMKVIELYNKLHQSLDCKKSTIQSKIVATNSEALP